MNIIILFALFNLIQFNLIHFTNGMNITDFESCLNKTKSLFIDCRNEYEKIWNVKLNYSMIDQKEFHGSECCLWWDYVDCTSEKVKSNCGFSESLEYEYFKKLWEDNHLWLKCKDFGHYSRQCHFPSWAIICIIIGVFVMAGSIGVIFITFTRIKQEIKKR